MEGMDPVLDPMANSSTQNYTGLWGHTTPKMHLVSLHGAQFHLKDLVGIFFMVSLNIVALLANTAVMVVIIKAPHLRKFAFVGHLCLVDLLCAVLLMPLGIVSSSPFFRSVVFTVLECQVYICLNVFLVCASILTITAISIERYYYIVHPMRYEVKMTLNLAVTVIVFIWFKSIILALVTLLGWPVYRGHSTSGTAYCFLHWSQSNNRKVFAIIFTVLCFCLPALVIFTVYCNVYKVARVAARQHGSLPTWATNPKRRSDSINSQTTIITTRSVPQRISRDRIFGGGKAAFTLIVIVGQFLVCWLPYFSFHLHLSLRASLQNLGDMGVAITWLAYSSFAVNPFFYGLLNRQIREELLKLRRCFSTRPVELAASSHDGSAQENFLHFLQRTSCTMETRSSCVISSPRLTLDQTMQNFRIPGQIPEDFS
ncbi:putative G-protein coupled receptor [Scleropages formosus]|nr:probable G-protein coupled receptor [Scleropages formosus]XP_018612072.1 probable G-protein coupled receptor [Scleropages formosus]XP_018612073.1 probable G-protein coupled receptor [Scleropages formosus]XP_029116027.1 probable G-protein coupled receptor [Scleropages formosus]KPP68724.1 putative G-protein coupled receptor [Scleropages formosus]